VKRTHQCFGTRSRLAWPILSYHRAHVCVQTLRVNANASASDHGRVMNASVRARLVS
jgi:hypothetical protein